MNTNKPKSVDEQSEEYLVERFPHLYIAKRDEENFRVDSEIFKSGYLKGREDGLKEVVKIPRGIIEGMMKEFPQNIDYSADTVKFILSNIELQIQNLIGSGK